MVAEAFLNYYVEITYHTLRNKIIYLFIYVNDILVKYDGSEKQWRSLENSMSSIHTNIPFWMETENNFLINFLYICRVNHRIISNSSVTPPSTTKKLQTIRMFTRLKRIPLSCKNYNKELNIKGK